MATQKLDIKDPIWVWMEKINNNLTIIDGIDLDDITEVVEEVIAQTTNAELSAIQAKESEDEAKISQDAAVLAAARATDMAIQADHSMLEAGIAADVAIEARDEIIPKVATAVSSANAATIKANEANSYAASAMASKNAAQASAEQFALNFAQMAEDIIRTQTIVVEHHGFGE